MLGSVVASVKDIRVASTRGQERPPPGGGIAQELPGVRNCTSIFLNVKFDKSGGVVGRRSLGNADCVKSARSRMKKTGDAPPTIGPERGSALRLPP